MSTTPSSDIRPAPAVLAISLATNVATNVATNLATNLAISTTPAAGSRQGVRP